MTSGKRRLMKNLVIILAGIFILFGSFTLTSGVIAQENVSGAKVTCDFSTLGNQVICPVTGDKFRIVKDSPSLDYKGKKYFFCCGACTSKFKANPESYLKDKKQAPHHH